MYRIELTPGEVTVFRTVEELAIGIRNGLITSRARIWHNAGNKWLPIEFHPHYREALEHLDAPSGASSLPAMPVGNSPGARPPLTLEPKRASPTAFEPAATPRRGVEATATPIRMVEPATTPRRVVEPVATPRTPLEPSPVAAETIEVVEAPAPPTPLTTARHQRSGVQALGWISFGLALAVGAAVGIAAMRSSSALAKRSQPVADPRPSSIAEVARTTPEPATTVTAMPGDAAPLPHAEPADSGFATPRPIPGGAVVRGPIQAPPVAAPPVTTPEPTLVVPAAPAMDLSVPADILDGSTPSSEGADSSQRTSAAVLGSAQASTRP